MGASRSATAASDRDAQRAMSLAAAKAGALSSGPVSATWAKLFAQWDQNGDGRVSSAEFLRAVRGDLNVPARDVGDDKLATLVRNLDADRSGDVSLDEVRARAVERRARARRPARAAERAREAAERGGSGGAVADV